MDYAEGGSLKRAIDGGRITDWTDKKRIAQEIVRGLAYIHHEGVIHRDLKSMNILFTRHMEVKLCDFGLATLKVRSASLTPTLKEQPNNEMVIRHVEAGRREELPENTPDDYRKWIERCWDHDPLMRPEASEM
ncbi:hypothetical protein BGZ73_004446, partial [Actinomortierella ambigua]